MQSQQPLSENPGKEWTQKEFELRLKKPKENINIRCGQGVGDSNGSLEDFEHLILQSGRKSLRSRRSQGCRSPKDNNQKNNLEKSTKLYKVDYDMQNNVKYEIIYKTGQNSPVKDSNQNLGSL